MDKIKLKVIGVLRERDGGNRSGSGGLGAAAGGSGGVSASTGHQLASPGVGVAAPAIGVAQDNNNEGNAPTIEAQATGAAPGASGVGVGGAARTSVLSRPQTSKISALDLAGILNTRRRLEWTKEWLRKNQAEFLSKENLLSELQSRKDECYHLNYFLAITESQFRYLVQKLEPIISQYAPQRKKKSFSAEERLAITLKYLATGEVHSCRNYCFRASKFVINEMIANICLGFYEHLKDQYVTLPKTDDQWRSAAEEMERKHNLPHCVGNLFMRSVQLQGTGSGSGSGAAGSGSAGGDDRKRATVIFTGIVDADNNFQYAKVERAASSRPNDIYNQTTAVELIRHKMHALEEQQSAEMDRQGYYFAGDSVLPATSYLVTTRNLPKDRAVLEALEQVNAHADQTMRILCNMFPILAQPLRISDKHIREVVLGCVALYNFLRKTDDSFRRTSDSIVQQRAEQQQLAAAYSVDSDEIDDDCIMLATEEELRERAEFTPSVGLTTCFQPLCTQRGETPEGLAKRDWLLQLDFGGQGGNGSGIGLGIGSGDGNGSMSGNGGLGGSTDSASGSSNGSLY
ncbi:uncharacterized protein LOC128258499 [Drosophila gunungcola]|uniref:DDE Tnp4 domain-containing protein n=1 Tax=Drosophila gunungcola TaxID=103775 RepID=A0A9Q0BQQ3_9MUSC|nr:uncharacterized protein LOC128258499 [Drosophila gunungcola]KAI8040294.1 hypothetical protein M5D96_006234 [Drosophila gunungcola]